MPSREGGARVLVTSACSASAPVTAGGTRQFKLLTSAWRALITSPWVSDQGKLLGAPLRFGQHAICPFGALRPLHCARCVAFVEWL